MDYIRTDADGQLTFTQSTEFLKIPSCLYGFVNESTSTGQSVSGRTVIRFSGSLTADDEDLTFHCCGSKKWDMDYLGKPETITFTLKAEVTSNGTDYAPVTVEHAANDDYLKQDFGDGSTVKTTSSVSQVIAVDGSGWHEENDGCWVGPGEGQYAYWEKLPIYANGYPVHYYVVEEPVKGFIATSVHDASKPIVGTAQGAEYPKSDEDNVNTMH